MSLYFDLFIRQKSVLGSLVPLNTWIIIQFIVPKLCFSLQTWTSELLFISLCPNCDFLFKPKSCVLWEVWYRWTAELLFRSLCPNCAFLFKPEHLNYNSYHCAQTVTFFPPKSCVLLLFSDSSPVAWWRLPPSVHCVWTTSQQRAYNHHRRLHEEEWLPLSNQAWLELYLWA